MRIEEIILCNKPALMIYTTQQEHDEESFQSKVDKYKEKFKDIAVFISGTQPIEETFRKIIKLYS